MAWVDTWDLVQAIWVKNLTVEDVDFLIDAGIDPR